MTKSRIQRLIDLSEICVSREAGEEKDALWEEFRAWEPDRELDEARMVARSAYWNLPTLIMHLPTGKYWHVAEYPWLDPGKKSQEQG